MISDRWSVTSRVGFALALCLAAPATASAQDKGPQQIVTAQFNALETNKLTPVYSGPPGIIAVQARFTWLPEMKRGLIWPCYHYKTKAYTHAMHAKLHLYDPAEGKWSTVASTFPKDWFAEVGTIAKSSVYLPGLERVLFLWGGSSRKGRKSCTSWLLDPHAATWEPLEKQPRMCDVSSTFQPARGADGSSIPLLGTLVYDAHNREAVSIGGGGTWGRVGKDPEKVEVGDWIYDEANMPKRVRRLTSKDLDKDGKLKIAEARKWYPANCGTWVFSEAKKTWRAIGQPLRDQPPGRVLCDAAYSPWAKKIVMFGGEDFQRCLRDTWIYDCATRTWNEAKPKVGPSARACHATVTVPDQKVVLLAGGYGPGWVPLRDVWVYSLEKNEWVKLAFELPASRYWSADYEPRSKTVLLSYSVPRWGKNKTTTILGLKLNLKETPLALVPKSVDSKLEYHCKHKVWPAPLPEEWDSPANKPGDPEAGRVALAALPTNTWVHRVPPMKVRARQWGKYIYDRRTHKAYAWGGGHYGYIGAEMSEYDILTNRWRNMNDPVNYKLVWQHPAAGGFPGVSFQGWRLMGTHARKTYHVDPISNSVITVHGDVYDIPERRFVVNIGRRSDGWGASGQHADVTTPHGLYTFAADRSTRKGGLRRANVAAGKWDLIATGGPSRHHEYDTLCYDAKRDRIIHTHGKGAVVSVFDFKSRKWAIEKPAGKAPATVLGDSCYVDDLDAMMWVFGGSYRKPAPTMYFYKLDERKWYTAPYKGAVVGWYGNLNNSPCYDPKLKLCVRLTHFDRSKFVEVLVMRLEPKALTLTPLE